MQDEQDYILDTIGKYIKQLINAMLITARHVTDTATPPDFSRYMEALNTFIWGVDEAAGTWCYIQSWTEKRTNYYKIIEKMDGIVTIVQEIICNYATSTTASHYNSLFGFYGRQIITSVTELKSSLLPIKKDFRASMESINNILLKISL